MPATARRLILLFSLVGLGFAASSSWVHYKLLTDGSYVSPCDVTATFNCTQAYLSPYGSVAGVPIALLGVFFFGLVGLVAWWSRPVATDQAGPATTYVFALSTVALAAVLYLAYASYSDLKVWCLLCLGTYAGVTGLFITSGATSSRSMFSLPARLATDLRAALSDRRALVTLILLAGTTAWAAAVFPKEGTRPAPPQAAPSADASASFATAWGQQPRVDLGIPADGAQVVVVKFNDYQCPGCRETHEWYKPVLAKFAQSHPGAIKYVVKDWPWNAKCNFNTQANLHTGACEAAAAVRMGRALGKATDMEEWVFANQRATPAEVSAAARTLLGVTDFDAEYARHLPDIRRDIADGGALSIRSTPTLFINGVRVEQMMPPHYFEMAIALELSKAGGK